jgi:hypothetical protein
LATYNGLRSSLLKILEINKKYKKHHPEKCTQKVACPVFFRESLHMDLMAGTYLHGNASMCRVLKSIDVRLYVQQMSRAFASVVSPPLRVLSSLENIRARHRLLVTLPESNIDFRQLQEDTLSGALGK